MIDPREHVQSMRPDFAFQSDHRLLWSEATLNAGQSFYDT